MASSIIKVTVLGDAKALEREFGGAGKSADNLGKKFSLLGKAAVAYLAFQAVRAVKDFVGDSKRAFIALNESINAVNVTYGEHADGIIRMARSAATSVGMSASEFNNFAVKFAAFAQKVAGPGGDVVGIVGDISKRVADFASVMNIDVATATDKFMSGLAGQSRPLREYGIDLSDTAVKLHAVAEGLHTGKGEMSESLKVQARYSLLMKETNKAAGDFANTSDQLANAQRIANARMEDAKAAFGEAIQGAFKPAAPLMGVVAGAVTRLSEAFSVLTGQITKAEQATRAYDRENEDVIPTLDRAAAIIKGMNDVTGENVLAIGLAALGLHGYAASAAIASSATHDMSTVIDELATKDLQKLVDMNAETVKTLFDVSDATEIQSIAQDKLTTRIRHAMDPYRMLAGEVETLTENEYELAEAQRAAEQATRRNTLAMEAQSDRIRRQTDPLFDLISSWQEYEEGQQAVLDAEKEFGTGSSQHLAAIAARGRAFLNVQGILDNLAASPVTDEMWRNMATAMNIPKREADLIWARIMEIRKLNGTVVNIRVNENVVVSKSGTGGAGTGGVQRAHGGRVLAGQNVQVNEKGQEVFIPDTSGRVVAAGAGGGNNYSITVNALDPQSAAKAVVEALQQYERQYGPIPVDVRT